MITWVIGDIHGCLNQLNIMLDKLNEAGWDRLIFLGDYIDRGPDSKGVIDTIMSLQKDFGLDKIIALKGNHEDMCLHNYAYKNNLDRQLGGAWSCNGAKQTIDSFNAFGGYEPIPDEYLEWMNNLPLMCEDENAYYVHAGFLPEVEPAYQLEEDMLWIRHEFLNSDYDWGKPVIFGHTPVKLVQDLGNKIAIDTGCVYGEYLSAYCVEAKKVLKVTNNG